MAHGEGLSCGARADEHLEERGRVVPHSSRCRLVVLGKEWERLRRTSTEGARSVESQASDQFIKQNNNGTKTEKGESVTPEQKEGPLSTR